MISRKAKEKMLEEIKADLKEASLVIVTDYRGLNVKAINELRRRLGAEECRYRVTKNTMNRLACRQVGAAELEDFFTGPTAVAYSSGDPVAAAKVFKSFAVENEALVVKGGMLEGSLLDAAQVRALGDIPPREVLLARVVGGMQAPISGFVGVLQGTLRSLVYTLDAVRREKESA